MYENGEQYLICKSVMEYSLLKGKSNVIIFCENIDISKMLTEYGETLEQLGMSCETITADEYPTTPYKGNVTHLDLICPNFSKSALTWMEESGFLSSPTIIELRMQVFPSDQMIDIFPRIDMPNLTKLHIGGMSHKSEDELIGQHILQLLARSLSVTTLSISYDFECDASVFLDHIGSMPALRTLSITYTNISSDDICRWASSNKNTTVESLTVLDCPTMDSLSPNEFFLHPCLSSVQYETILVNKFKTMHTAKHRAVHYAYTVGNNKAMIRLPTELVRMVFEMYDQ
jgi:hypothetical protein